MTEWSKDLVLYHMARAQKTLEDARILANAGRWNASDMHNTGSGNGSGIHLKAYTGEGGIASLTQ